MVQKKRKKGKKKNEALSEDVDLVQRYRLREKSKTMSAIDLKRTGEDPYDSDESQTFERKQSSFRKRINTFLQNSPFLKRATFLRQAPGLKNDISRLSDSLESLKIDENRVTKSDSKNIKIVDESRRMLSRRGKSKSCDQFNLSNSSLSDFANCSLCKIDDGAASAADCSDGTSLKSLPVEETPDLERSCVRRSSSLQSAVRPRSWLGVSRMNLLSKHLKNVAKSAKDQFCMDCGIPVDFLLLHESSFDLHPELTEQEPILIRPAKSGTNTPLNKETSKKQKRSKNSTPEHVDEGKCGNEVRSKTHEWTKKLVGSIRRKVNSKKSGSPPSSSSACDGQDGDDRPEVGGAPQEKAVETVKRMFTDEEELELSPPARKTSESGARGTALRRDCSKKSLDEESFEFCRIKRKLSFPCASEASDPKEQRFPKKKDTTLLAAIFKKQSSVDVKVSPTRVGQRRIPDVSVNMENGEVSGRVGESRAEVTSDDAKSNPDTEKVETAPKTTSRSCGQVEIISSDPARENFLQAAMSILLAVSPNSKIQVRSRSLTHIDQIEQGKPGSMFLKDMGSEKGADQLLVPAERTRSNRPVLSRSQASSSECFTVGFEGLQEEEPDDFVQASKNTILRDALLELCKKRGVDLGNSNVFLDANKSPLPCLDIDTSWMAGKHIRIKVNDRVTIRKDAKTSLGSTTPLKKISSNYRSNKSGNRTHNVSSEEASLAEPGPSSKGTKRWSGFFGTSRDTSKMETLVDLLDSYTKNGIYEYEDIYNMEPDWKSIVTNANELEDRHSQQQEAIWELLRSEIDYIKMLRVVSQLFIACLVNLQSNQLLLEIDNKKLFGNVEEIYNCNDLFWKKYLVPVVEASRKTGEPLNPEHLKEAFVNFPGFFKCYETYCSQQSRCQHYCREKLQQDQDNELFTAYLAWCETQKECNRLKLLDILVKPMQRLTKYSLLLKAILKHTSNPSHRDSLIAMIRNVDLFVNHVNSTLKQNQDLEVLRQLMGKIESYDVIDTKDEDLSHLIQKYSSLNLTYDIPGTNHKRSLIFDSDVKYKDVLTSSKIEIHAFLFTDMLLVTKPIKRLGESKVKFKIIRQPFVVDRLVTQEVARDPPTLACVYLSIYQTACSAFVLSCGEIDLIKNWSDAIKKAKNLFTSLKSSAGAQPLQPPTTLPISRQQSGLTDEEATAGDNPEENKGVNYNLGLWFGRSPRGSSRGSRLSSLVHSHSGSMEMTENISSLSSVSASRGVSVDNNSEVRGSSLSSDDGNANLAPSPRLELTTSPRSEKREASPHSDRRESPISPRPESKSLYKKANNKSENTLTIHVPHLGQSLPNLNIASSPCCSNTNPSPPNTLLLAPPKSHGGFLSPSQRGVSYPPPSPPRGSLKRGLAIAPRNPPLVKTGHISVELARSLSVAQPQGEAEEKSLKTIGLQTNLGEDASGQTAPGQGGGKCEQCRCSGKGAANGKKLVRSDKRCGGEEPKTSNLRREGKRDPKDPAKTRVGLGHGSSRLSPAARAEDGSEKKEPEIGRSFKFDEILHLISLEGEETKSSENTRSDLEEFENKVSKWQKYGYREEGEGRDNSFNLGAVKRSPRESRPPERAASKAMKTSSFNFASSVDPDISVSSAIKALNLEPFRGPTGKMKKTGTAKKRKRRETI